MTRPLDAFQNTQPMAVRFLSRALESHSLAHAYLFLGRNVGELYNVALAIAAILNCRESASPVDACGQCRNCKWIQDNAHPAVQTVSRLTYGALDAGNKKSAHTQISGEQISRLITQLSLSSADRRVVIFTDVEEMPSALASSAIAPYEWRSIAENEDKSLHIRPLNRRVFNTTAANRFLKTLEEPTPNTLFLFLSDTVDNVLETIVSRCQVLPFQSPPPSQEEQCPTPAQMLLFDELMSHLEAPRMADPYVLADRFNASLIQGEGLTLLQALERFQVYLRYRFMSGPKDSDFFHRYVRHQRSLERARSMVKSKTHLDHTLVMLLFGLDSTTSQWSSAGNGKFLWTSSHHSG